MSLLSNPLVFPTTAAIRNKQLGRHCWVTSGSHLAIEGFPRSANTYLHRIVRAATQDRLNIANHVHRPEQIIFALRYGVPTFVLFRHPLDSIASYLVREPAHSLPLIIQRYIDLAEVTLARRNNSLLRTVMFEDVIANPSGVAIAILSRIGETAEMTTDLIVQATRDTRVEKTRSSLPNKEKDALKTKHFDAIQLQPHYKKALELFHRAEATKWQF